MSNTATMIWMLMLTVFLTVLEVSRDNVRVIGVVCVALAAGMFVGEFIRRKVQGR